MDIHFLFAKKRCRQMSCDWFR